MLHLLQSGDEFTWRTVYWQSCMSVQKETLPNIRITTEGRKNILRDLAGQPALNKNLPLNNDNCRWRVGHTDSIFETNSLYSSPNGSS